MSGYTPVFDTVFDGTLCGQWPTLPVWLTILPLADWRGHIDMTVQAIAARTGWPLELLRQGIEALCQPDPQSRSPAEEGRRLVPIDPAREWGWRVVNIQVYRRKCSDVDQVTDGRNAKKVRSYKKRHRRTPQDTAGHPQTLTHTHTHTQTHTQTKKEQEQEAPAAPGLDALAWEKWLGYRKRRKPAIRPESIEAAQKKLAEFGAEQMAVVENSIANGYQGLIEPKLNGVARKAYVPAPTTAELEAEEAKRAIG